MKTKLSPIIIKTFVALFVLGMLAGLIVYLNRSTIIERHLPGDNAIPAHVAIAVISVIIVIAIQVWRNKHKKSNIWLAPFTQHAWGRLRDTLTLKPRFSLVGVLRLLVSVPITLLALFFFFRSGQQVTAMFDTNFVINGWGGPTAIGASLAHWMDGIILFYIEAWLLSIVMQRR